MSLNNPFMWQSNPRDSIFLADPKFSKAASTGKTMSQIQSATVDAITKRTGKNPGTLDLSSNSVGRMGHPAPVRKKRG
jgi:hypothetical protein